MTAVTRAGLRLFTDQLSKAGEIVTTEFPWRLKRTPYRVLMSELLLAKTTASQVSAVFPRLIADYPGPKELAQARLVDLHAIVYPLGLHNRANSLISIGTALTRIHGAKVPQLLEHLLELRSVGPYIANATLCFGFGERVPIVDTGIARLIDRYFGNVITRRHSPYRDPEAWAIASNYVSLFPYDPAQANYILLDIARTICTSKAPKCAICPLEPGCALAKKNGQAARPNQVA